MKDYKDENRPGRTMASFCWFLTKAIFLLLKVKWKQYNNNDKWCKKIFCVLIALHMYCCHSFKIHKSKTCIQKQKNLCLVKDNHDQITPIFIIMRVHFSALFVISPPPLLITITRISYVSIARLFLIIHKTGKPLLLCKQNLSF